MTNALEASHLTIHFDGRDVIRDLSFAVAQGDCLAIIGPNGAGKTVLLKALVGAVPHEGTIHWAAGARVGYVPQKLDIERDLPITAGDLLKAKAHVGRSSRADIGWSLELVNLAPDILNARIGALSGGQFQRLLLAFAFLGKPTVLLFDEPTAGIDEPGEERLYERINRLRAQQQFTLLLISHELSLVYRYATKVLCLGRGQAHLGAPTEVLTPGMLEELYGSPTKYHFHE